MSGHKLVLAMTSQMLLHVWVFHLIWSLFFSKEQLKILQNLNYDLLSHWWNWPLAIWEILCISVTYYGHEKKCDEVCVPSPNELPAYPIEICKMKLPKANYISSKYCDALKRSYQKCFFISIKILEISEQEGGHMPAFGIFLAFSLFPNQHYVCPWLCGSQMITGFFFTG